MKRNDRAGKQKGSLVCVGVGITLGSHLTPLARSYIECADVVFMAVSDGVVELWLKQMNGDVRSLQRYYRKGKSRSLTYGQMVDAMLREVRAGKNVCSAFYGHPGIFAWSPHEAIAMARSEGYSAHMEPGISAEDCLYADLGIDPGTFGCQHYEAGQLLYYKCRVNPAAYLVLWQVGAVGADALSRAATGSAHRRLLLDVLAREYPRDHDIIIYRAATLPVRPPLIRHVQLRRLATARIDPADTVVIPPAQAPEADEQIGVRLREIDRRGRR